jgi:hypothetical protein
MPSRLTSPLRLCLLAATVWPHIVRRHPLLDAGVAQQGTQMLDGEFLGRNAFATTNASDSFVSKAIF